MEKLTSSMPCRISSTIRSPERGAEGQVHLGDVPGDHHLGAEAEPGQEHLHLFRRGVLRLVQDDERVVERAAAHVGQRGHLDGPGGHQPRNRFRVHHVVQRVVQRAQVRVDLVAEGAGQEAQPLPCLDGRPGQDDPADFLLLQGLDGLGHGQVRLAGTGRADAENNGVARRWRRHSSSGSASWAGWYARGWKGCCASALPPGGHGLGAQHGHQLLKNGRSDHGLALHQSAHFLEEPHDPGHLGSRTGDGKLVAARHGSPRQDSWPR